MRTHDNQPVLCYLCEKAAERWEISVNVLDMKREAIIQCHGQTEIIEIDEFRLQDMIDFVDRPIIAFQPPPGETCPTKFLLGLVDVTPETRDPLLLGGPES